MKYQFKYIETDLYGKENGKTMVMEFSADALSDILENFEYFLRGSGFLIDGTIDIIGEESYEGDEYSINLTNEEETAHSKYYYDYDRNRSPEQMDLDFGEAKSTLQVNTPTFDLETMSPFIQTADDMFQDDLNGR
jgi:hypothetical protein